MILRRRAGGDRGATLILVLIIVSLISLVMGVVLATADTSVRTTIALRDQASDNYAADGAAQAMLNALKTAGIHCSSLTDPTYERPLGSVASPFYSPVSSEQGPINAYAKCTLDQLNGTSATVSVSVSTSVSTPAPVTSTAPYLGQGDPTLPTYAVLTTGSSATDFGLNIADSANNKILCVEDGSVGSNADINASGETLAVRLSGTGTAGGDCTTGSGVDASTGTKLIITAARTCAGTFTPTGCTQKSPTIDTPAAPALSGPITAVDPAPTCDSSSTYAAFLPGLYTNASWLNLPCSDKKGNRVAAPVEWFSPGTYYFNYGSTAWTWPTSTLIAGTPIDQSTGKPIAGLNPTGAGTLSKLGNAAASPGACDDPSHPKDGVGAVGVSMIFAGSSTVNASHQGVAEICASSPSGSPPIAIYGLSVDQTIAKSSGGSVTLPAETMCSSGCGSNSLIVTDSSGLTQIYINGYVYAPQAQINLRVKNTAGQVFNWGVIARNLSIFVNGSSPTQPVIHLPKPNTGVGLVVTTSTPPPSTTVASVTATVTTYTIRYVNVWTCTVASLQASGQTQCPHTGAPNVQLRILTDPNGVPQKILSWTNLG